MLQTSIEDAEAFAQRAQQLLQSKADMLQECVGLAIDASGCLAALPVLCAPLWAECSTCTPGILLDCVVSLAKCAMTAGLLCNGRCGHCLQTCHDGLQSELSVVLVQD